MSPTQFQAKRKDKCPPPLKINKASHFVKKPPSSSSLPTSTCISSTNNGISSCTIPPRRQPVIIYTHSPKVIHTNSRDFMTLVQKLTGLSYSNDDSLLLPSTPKFVMQTKKKRVVRGGGGGAGDDNESSLGVTEETLYCLGNNGCVDSCMVPQMLEPPMDYMDNIPIFSSKLTDFLCSNQTYYNYPDSILLNSFDTRNSSTFDGPNMNQLH